MELGMADVIPTHGWRPLSIHYGKQLVLVFKCNLSPCQRKWRPLISPMCWGNLLGSLEFASLCRGMLCENGSACVTVLSPCPNSDASGNSIVLQECLIFYTHITCRGIFFCAATWTKVLVTDGDLSIISSSRFPSSYLFILEASSTFSAL